MNEDMRNKIENFFNSYPLVAYPKDQILIFPGEKTEKIYFIVSGRVSQYDISYRGDEIVVNTFKPPAFFAMALAIDHTVSRFFYKAETKAELRVAPAAEVIDFLKANPSVTYDLLARVYRGVESILDRMVHLMSGTAKSRLIFDLIIELKRFGKVAGGRRYIEASETSIASRSGLSRETISREMKHLKAKGLVEIKSRRIYINSLAELEEQLTSHA